MLVRNLDDGLTNGTIGTVKGFYTYAAATGDKVYRKKIGFVRNICVTDEGIPKSYSPVPGPSMLFPLVEFYLNEGPEHVLILPMEFQAELDGKAAAKRIQVFFVSSLVHHIVHVVV